MVSYQEQHPSRAATEAPEHAARFISKPRPAKRLFRSAMRRLPRSKLSFNLGKAVLRTVLRPEPQSTTVRFRFGAGPVLLADLSDMASNDIFCTDRHYESATLTLWEKLAREAKVILDLGAHVGTFALVAANINPLARILAVEAFPPNAAMLRTNAAPYPNVRVVQVAIAPETGDSRFVVDNRSGGGFLRLDSETTAPTQARVSQGRTITVPTLSLAALVTQHNIDSIDLAKMDLEGLEVELLTGQDAFWKVTPPRHLIVEIGCMKRNRERLHRSLAAMTRKGYRGHCVQNLYALPWMSRRILANWWFAARSEHS